MPVPDFLSFSSLSPLSWLFLFHLILLSLLIADASTISLYGTRIYTIELRRKVAILLNQTAIAKQATQQRQTHHQNKQPPLLFGVHRDNRGVMAAWMTLTSR